MFNYYCNQLVNVYDLKKLFSVVWACINSTIKTFYYYTVAERTLLWMYENLIYTWSIEHGVF